MQSNVESTSCKRATVDRRTKNDHAPSPHHAAKPFSAIFGFIQKHEMNIFLPFGAYCIHVLILFTSITSAQLCIRSCRRFTCSYLHRHATTSFMDMKQTSYKCCQTHMPTHTHVHTHTHIHAHRIRRAKEQTLQQAN